MTDDALPEETKEAEVSALAATQYALTGLRRCNLKRNTWEALEMMAFEGLPLPLVAERKGIRSDNLMRAFDRPRVRNAFNQVVKAIRDNAAQAAYLRINNMGINASSEQVRLKANVFVAGVDGISPVHKVQGQHQISHSFGGFDYGGIGGAEDDQSPAIDGQATDITPKKSER